MVDDTLVPRVRRFNRTVTQRLGVLHDRYLARDHSLGEARLLWEIGPDGRDVRSLRTDLELDSGYVSRLLRSLETAGLVSVHAGESDRRVRRAHLTPAGATERTILDKRSDELAASMLEHLSHEQQLRLVEAMEQVELLLTATVVKVAPVDPSHPHARHCLREYFQELDQRFDVGFDPRRSIPADTDDLRLPNGLLLLATLRHKPVGCGALKLHPDQPAELKRMWVDRTARGLGLGRRLLSDLEHHAAGHGAQCVRLETNRALTEAIGLYRSAGYSEVPRFNDEPYAHHWFEKKLPAVPSP